MIHRIVFANMQVQATSYAKTKVDHDVVPFVVALERTRNHVIARTMPPEKNMSSRSAGLQNNFTINSDSGLPGSLGRLGINLNVHARTPGA